ncbi:MAG: SDR family NAD(P)-dependent oxidoreductase [Myxococcota bacterium]
MGSFVDRYGPWAVVAGASEGLGEAFADGLAARGCHLVLLARRPDALDRVRARLEATYGVSVRAVPCDLADPSFVEALAAATADVEVGVAVYDAAASFTGPLLDRPVADALRVVDVNVRGPLLLVHALVPAMVRRGRGGLVLMSSLVGIVGSPNLAAYASSKAFTTALGQSLWSELGPRGVDVVVSVAGAIRTPNYRAASKRDAPGTQDPAAVVAQALDGLGRGPVVVPRWVPRLAALLVGRLLPRRAALAVFAVSTADALEGLS